MRHFITLKSLFILLALSMPGYVSADTTIAVIDQQRALFGSDAAEGVSSELRSQLGGVEEQVRGLEQEITRLRERGEQESALMSEDELQSLNEEIQSKLQEREQLVRQLQEAQQQRQQAFLQEYQGQLTAILQEIIEERGIDLLISTEEVLYARPDMDITDEALERFNEQTQ